MDKKDLRDQLSRWFPDFKVGQIINIIESHKGDRVGKKKIVNKALKQIQELDKTLKQIEREFPAVYEKLDDIPRLSRLAKEGFNNQREESLADTIKLIENSIGVRLNSFTKSPTANSFKRTENGDSQYYSTNNEKDKFQLVMELEQLWEVCTRIPIKKSDDNEFMIFLSVCLYEGDESKSDAARKLYERCRTPAEYFGQRRSDDSVK